MRRVVIAFIAFAALAASVPAAPASADATPACTITGSFGADVLDGTAGDDVICGLGGNDVINAGEGDDVIIAGDGNDTIVGDAGTDTIYGDAGDDTIDAGAGADTVYGAAGDDTIDAGTGDDLVYGDAGDDRIAGGPGADQLWAGDGSDLLRGAAGNDVLIGGAGADSEYGDAGIDYCETDPADPVNASCFRDNSAPKPISASFRESRINPQDSDQVVHLRMRMKEYGTGVSSLYVTIAGGMYQFFASVNGQPRCGEQPAAAGSGCLRSGDSLHGIWEFGFLIPRYLPATRIELTQLMVSDAAGNDRFVEVHGELAVSFRTTGRGDRTAPVIRDVTALGRPSIDASAMDQVPVNVRATDDLSGIARIMVDWGLSGCYSYKNGWLNKKVCSSAISTNTMYMSDFTDNGNGTFTGTIAANPEMFNGLWVPTSIVLVDKVGNRRELLGVDASRYASYFAFTIINGKPFRLADSQDPVLQSVTLSPARVNTAAASATVIVRLHVTDNKAVGDVWASATSPNGLGSVALKPCPLESGTAKDGVWACPIVLPVHGATGYWQVELTVTDRSNNQARWSPAVTAVMNANGYRIRNG